MSLSPNQVIGPYRLVAKLGEGGMGEVWRAQDSRLHRDVAIKAMPDSVASDPERIARFEREAQILAALKHPGIAGIHGLEYVERARYLVLEYVEGASLAETLARGPVPMDEALGIARQIADALEAAHERGIIHRDLKPANIMLTPDGVVKVLDFGLAKALGPDGTGASADGMNSPTLSAATQVGVILGTAAYMAPEQAKGRGADKRCDVWAFGCVLFELLTRTRAFTGEDVSDTLAAVLRADPDWTKLPTATPPPIAQLVRRCLIKDRRLRIPDISVARFEIDDWTSGRSVPPAQASATLAPPPARRGRMTLVAIAAALAGAAVTATVISTALWPSPTPKKTMRFAIEPPATALPRVRTAGPGIDIALSADASKVVYRVGSPAGEMLALRELANTDSVLLPMTAGLVFSFSLSPDGTALAFHQGTGIQVLQFGSAKATPLVELAQSPIGTRWLSNDTIVYSSQGKLFRIRLGGVPELVAEPPPAAEGTGRTDYLFPEVVPGGDVILYTSATPSARRIEARRLAGGNPTVVAENGSFPRLTSSGMLLFVRDGRLMAARFDASSLAIVGQTVTLDEAIGPLKGRGASSFDVAADGTFVALAASALPFTSRFAWRSRNGTTVAHVGSDLAYPRYQRISHDGKRMAATVGAANDGQIWVFDLVGTAQPQKLTFEGHNVFPMWTPDDRHLVFWSTSAAGNARVLRKMPADGSELTPESLWEMPVTTVGVLTPDGTSVLYQTSSASTGLDLTLFKIGSNQAPTRWLGERFSEGTPAFSRDGHWVAYMSTQTGAVEVWVRPFPGPGAPVRVSSAGGREPMWSRDGRELFFQVENKLFAAPITITGATLTAGEPRFLFGDGFIPFEDTTPRTYDVSKDGRFLMIEQPKQTERTLLTVVVGFDELLKQRLR